MKRLVSFMLFAILAITSVYAGRLKTTNGDASIVRNPDATAFVEINLEGCRWEKKEDYKAWCGNDYDARSGAAVVAGFTSGFNDKTKGMKIVPTKNNAKYSIVFNVVNMQRKQGMGMWGSCFIKLYGTIIVTDLSTGEKVATIEVDGQNGDTDFVETDRIVKAFAGVGEAMAKIKK